MKEEGKIEKIGNGCIIFVAVGSVLSAFFYASHEFFGNGLYGVAIGLIIYYLLDKF